MEGVSGQSYRVSKVELDSNVFEGRNDFFGERVGLERNFRSLHNEDLLMGPVEQVLKDANVRKCEIDDSDDEVMYFLSFLHSLLTLFLSELRLTQLMVLIW